MKLRIRGNSIRLRLTKSEVDRINEFGSVEERVEFGNGKSQFYYRLESDNKTEKLSARFENGQLSVAIPQTAAAEWTNSDMVGIEALQPIGSDAFLRILIEKDFTCQKERTGEDDSDAFPNSTIDEVC